MTPCFSSKIRTYLGNAVRAALPAAAALPEMPIPQGALDDGADLDVVARQDLRRQLDDLAAEGHRKKNMKTLADLVEAGLDNT